VRSASPPAATTDRAGIAEGSPAGERSGRGAVPGPAQDGETSTVDQSREWPQRDTAPRQDPAESRLDPIWGGDPPDAVRWHMGMTNEEVATAQGEDPTTNAQAAPAKPHQNGTTGPARTAESASGDAPREAAPPAEPRMTHGKSSAATARPPHEAGPDVGWFSTAPGAGDPGAGQFEGTLSKQLSAERPGDQPPQGSSAGVQASARAAGDLDMDAPDTAGPVAAGSSTVPGGSSGIAEPTGPREPSAPEQSFSEVGGSVGPGEAVKAAGSSADPTAPDPAGWSPGAERSAAGDAGERVDAQASSGRSTGSLSGADEASFEGSVSGRQERRGPELIQSGMVYVDPDPEIGSPPSATGWSERSTTELAPSGDSKNRTSAAVPGDGGAGNAEAHGVVGSRGAGSGGEREDDDTGTAVPAPTEDPAAGEAADPGAGSDIGRPPNALAGGATRSAQAASAVPEEIDAESSGSGSRSDAEGASIGDETTEAGHAVDQSHAVAEAVPAAGATNEHAEPSHDVAPQVSTSAPAAVPEQDAGTTEVGTRDSRRSEVEARAEAGGVTEAGREADRVAGPADAAEASLHSTIDDTPWNEPALPMAWPPGMGPPVRGATSEPLDEGLDPEFGSEPDPTWPRLFGQVAEGEDNGAMADLSGGRQAATGSNWEIGRQQTGEGSPESPSSQPENEVFRAGGERDARLSTEGPQGSVPGPVDQAGPEAAADPEAAGANDPAGRSGDQDMATPLGALKTSDVVSAGITAGTDAPPASGDAGSPPDDEPAIVDVTTGQSGSVNEPATKPLGPERLSTATGAIDEGTGVAPVPEGSVGAAGHANISTATRAAQEGEVDLREVSASSRSVDVSRETSADGGEAMDLGREDETLEDEAAIAVRDAVSRAAAEAGVDVSRETDPTADFSIDEPNPEATIDTEAAARNARVTFRIHRDTQNGIRRVMAVANQKGGVGKSTTAVNIGAYLALAGARVLVIDLDPQGNASTGLGLDHRDIEPSIYDVLTGEAVPGAAIRATGVPNLHVLPSTIDLAGAEVELVSAMSRETRLRRALQSIDHQYDTILIDCPPSLGLLTVNALAAADELLIPIQCEYYALEGLGQLLRNVELVRANLNPDLRIGGIVLTMYDGRTRLALQVVDEVRKHFTDVVYQTVVPRSVRLSEAPGYGLPIALYDPLSRGGIAYRDLTFELAERSGLLAPNGEGAS
jgi:chromosome partitioning protein